MRINENKTKFSLTNYNNNTRVSLIHSRCSHSVNKRYKFLVLNVNKSERVCHGLNESIIRKLNEKGTAAFENNDCVVE